MGQDGDDDNFVPIPSMIIPKKIKKEDLESFINNNTVAYFRFDNVLYTKVNDLISIEMVRNDELIYSKFIFDNETGIVELYKLEGYFKEDERGAIVIFKKNTTEINDATETEKLHTKLVDNIEVYVNFSYTTSNDYDLYWAVLPDNPLGNFSIPYQIPNMPLYIDLYVNESTAVDVYKSNMTIYYDDSDLGEVPEDALNIYFFNMSSEEWEINPNVTIDSSSNQIVVKLAVSPYYALGTNMTCLVDWSVGINDEIYLSEMGELIRAVVDIVNITEVDISESDGPPALVGQPEKQEFSTLYGYIDFWNETLQDWENIGYYMLGGANNYWPIMITEGFPLILPINTKGDDFKPLFNLFPGYSSKIYGTNFVLLRNETEDISSRINFTSTGHILYFSLWIYYEDSDYWEYEAVYYGMNSTTLAPGIIEDYQLPYVLVDDWKFSMNITTTEAADFFWALLPYNPTHVPLDNGLPDGISIFFDLNTNNSDSVIWSNITIDYSDVDLAGNGIDPKDLTIYMFDIETETWVLASDVIDLIIIREDNKLIIIFPTNTLFAIGKKVPYTLPPPAAGGGGGGGGGEEEPEIVPGYHLSIMIPIIALISVAIILKRRKIKDIIKK